jgi:hypothetical protein
MNVPIRILGIAASIFWVILIAFIASAGYSIKDINFRFGEPQFSPAPSRDLMLSLPLYIENKGFYSLKAFNLTTVFSDAEGAEISRATSFVPVISQGESLVIFHNVTLRMNLQETGKQYLFNDSNLVCALAAGLNFADLVPAQVSTNITFPWGAPFYGFALGQQQIVPLDSSQYRVTVPMSFENHAAFNLTGNIRVRLYDGEDSLLAESQTLFDVAQQSPYAKKLEFIVPFSGERSGYFEVYFSTELFEYGPMVIPLD